MKELTDNNSFLDRLRTANVKRSIEWGCIEDSLSEGEVLFRSNEMGGECGEAQNAVKKYVRFLRNMPGGVGQCDSRRAIAEELADVIICTDRLADSFGINLKEAVIAKFNATSTKHEFKTKL